jgi:Fe2+ transport system protein FeoA
MHFRNRGNFQKRNPQSNEETASLTRLCEGERGVLTHSLGGFGLVRRLAEMGLTPGVEVRIVRRCPFRGPVEVEVRGVTLALGYGVASKVFVRRLKAEANG